MYQAKLSQMQTIPLNNCKISSSRMQCITQIRSNENSVLLTMCDFKSAFDDLFALCLQPPKRIKPRLKLLQFNNKRTIERKTQNRTQEMITINIICPDDSI